MSAMEDADPASTPPPTPQWVGRVLPSGLRVLASLGETPDGTLYSATYPTGLQVVLLILRYRLDRAGEAAVLASIRKRVLQAIELKHPNVAGVYATGATADGSDYIVLESLSGEPMSEMLAAGDSVSVPEAMDLCRQACTGLQAAHALGIVHGKLSPGSMVIVRAPGGILTVKLAGFRLTASPSEEDLKPGAGESYARYASPERLDGQTPDCRSDVYSLGAVLHHLVAGAPPTPGSVASTVPPALRPVLTKALAKAPRRRFQSMPEFVAALERSSAALRQPRRARAGWPVALGATAAVLVAAAGIELFWSSRDHITRAGTQVGIQETGRTVVVDRDSAPRPQAAPPAPRPVPSHQSRPTTTAAAPRPQSVPAPPAARDSAPLPRISPFRRSHPWAAAPGGRYYYRSSCPAALDLRDLIFFATEDEARAKGFLPSPNSDCR